MFTTGISNDEYRMLVVDSSKPAEAAGSLYALSGTNLNGTSGRVSFVLGLMGPAKAIDAACRLLPRVGSRRRG